MRSNGLPTGTLRRRHDADDAEPGDQRERDVPLRDHRRRGVRLDDRARSRTTGATAHSTTVTGLTNGGSYSFFVRCQDAATNANTNDFTISFSVAAAGRRRPGGGVQLQRG